MTSSRAEAGGVSCVLGMALGAQPRIAQSTEQERSGRARARRFHGQRSAKMSHGGDRTYKHDQNDDLHNTFSQGSVQRKRVAWIEVPISRVCVT